MTRKRSSPMGGLEIFLPALLALVMLPLLAQAAPVQDYTEIQQYTEGCYYNYNHYNEGDRIMTNEPCLNCTCHNKMLMCYLRVCPFTKPIGHDCIVEKREDQCCPIITCPEVPVDVAHAAPEPGTELSFPEKFGCSIDGKFFLEGAQVPSNPNKPCELCYCIRNRTSCLMQECTLHIDGCTPIYNKGSCCPVRYNCDHENDILGLDDMSSSTEVSTSTSTTTSSTTTTTERPTTGFILTSTMSPSVSTDCIHNGDLYADGGRIEGESPCENCYCMRGEIICAVQECKVPLMATNGKQCHALPPADGECCASNYVCEDDSASTEIYTETTTIGLVEDERKVTTSPSVNDLHGAIPEEDVQLQTHIDDEEGMATESEEEVKPTDAPSDEEELPTTTRAPIAIDSSTSRGDKDELVTEIPSASVDEKQESTTDADVIEEANTPKEEEAKAPSSDATTESEKDAESTEKTPEAQDLSTEITSDEAQPQEDEDTTAKTQLDQEVYKATTASSVDSSINEDETVSPVEQKPTERMEESTAAPSDKKPLDVSTEIIEGSTASVPSAEKPSESPKEEPSEASTEAVPGDDIPSESPEEEPSEVSTEAVPGAKKPSDSPEEEPSEASTDSVPGAEKPSESPDEEPSEASTETVPGAEKPTELPKEEPSDASTDGVSSADKPTESPKEEPSEGSTEAVSNAAKPPESPEEESSEASTETVPSDEKPSESADEEPSEASTEAVPAAEKPSDSPEETSDISTETVPASEKPSEPADEEISDASTEALSTDELSTLAPKEQDSITSTKPSEDAKPITETSSTKATVTDEGLGEVTELDKEAEVSTESIEEITKPSVPKLATETSTSHEEGEISTESVEEITKTSTPKLVTETSTSHEEEDEPSTEDMVTNVPDLHDRISGPSEEAQEEERITKIPGESADKEEKDETTEASGDNETKEPEVSFTTVPSVQHETPASSPAKPEENTSALPEIITDYDSTTGVSSKDVEPTSESTTEPLEKTKPSDAETEPYTEIPADDITKESEISTEKEMATKAPKIEDEDQQDLSATHAPAKETETKESSGDSDIVSTTASAFVPPVTEDVETDITSESPDGSDELGSGESASETIENDDTSKPTVLETSSEGESGETTMHYLDEITTVRSPAPAAAEEDEKEEDLTTLSPTESESTASSESSTQKSTISIDTSTSATKAGEKIDSTTALFEKKQDDADVTTQAAVQLPSSSTLSAMDKDSSEEEDTPKTDASEDGNAFEQTTTPKEIPIEQSQSTTAASVIEIVTQAEEDQQKVIPEMHEHKVDETAEDNVASTDLPLVTKEDVPVVTTPGISSEKEDITPQTDFPKTDSSTVVAPTVSDEKLPVSDKETTVESVVHDLSSEELPDMQLPAVIPGEGDCLVGQKTFENNTIIPTYNSDECMTCRCVSSIVACQRMKCVIPENIDECVVDETSSNKCCTTYLCGAERVPSKTETTDISPEEVEFTPPTQATTDKVETKLDSTPSSIPEIDIPIASTEEPMSHSKDESVHEGYEYGTKLPGAFEADDKTHSILDTDTVSTTQATIDEEHIKPVSLLPSESGTKKPAPEEKPSITDAPAAHEDLTTAIPSAISEEPEVKQTEVTTAVSSLDEYQTVKPIEQQSDVDDSSEEIILPDIDHSTIASKVPEIPDSQTVAPSEVTEEEKDEESSEEPELIITTPAGDLSPEHNEIIKTETTASTLLEDTEQEGSGAEEELTSVPITEKEEQTDVAIEVKIDTSSPKPSEDETKPSDVTSASPATVEVIDDHTELTSSKTPVEIVPSTVGDEKIDSTTTAASLDEPSSSVIPIDQEPFSEESTTHAASLSTEGEIAEEITTPTSDTKIVSSTTAPAEDSNTSTDIDSGLDNEIPAVTEPAKEEQPAAEDDQTSTVSPVVVDDTRKTTEKTPSPTVKPETITSEPEIEETDQELQTTAAYAADVSETSEITTDVPETDESQTAKPDVEKEIAKPEEHTGAPVSEASATEEHINIPLQTEKPEKPASVEEKKEQSTAAPAPSDEISTPIEDGVSSDTTVPSVEDESSIPVTESTEDKMVIGDEEKEISDASVTIPPIEEDSEELEPSMSQTVAPLGQEPEKEISHVPATSAPSIHDNATDKSTEKIATMETIVPVEAETKVPLAIGTDKIIPDESTTVTTVEKDEDQTTLESEHKMPSLDLLEETTKVSMESEEETFATTPQHVGAFVTERIDTTTSKPSKVEDKDAHTTSTDKPSEVSKVSNEPVTKAPETKDDKTSVPDISKAPLVPTTVETSSEEPSEEQTSTSAQSDDDNTSVTEVSSGQEDVDDEDVSVTDKVQMPTEDLLKVSTEPTDAEDVSTSKQPQDNLMALDVTKAPESIAPSEESVTKEKPENVDSAAVSVTSENIDVVTVKAPAEKEEADKITTPKESVDDLATTTVKSQEEASSRTPESIEGSGASTPQESEEDVPSATMPSASAEGVNTATAPEPEEDASVDAKTPETVVVVETSTVESDESIAPQNTEEDNLVATDAPVSPAQESTEGVSDSTKAPEGPLPAVDSSSSEPSEMAEITTPQDIIDTSPVTKHPLETTSDSFQESESPVTKSTETVDDIENITPSESEEDIAAVTTSPEPEISIKISTDQKSQEDTSSVTPAVGDFVTDVHEAIAATSEQPAKKPEETETVTPEKFEEDDSTSSQSPENDEDNEIATASESEEDMLDVTSHPKVEKPETSTAGQESSSVPSVTKVPESEESPEVNTIQGLPEDIPVVTEAPEIDDESDVSDVTKAPEMVPGVESETYVSDTTGVTKAPDAVKAPSTTEVSESEISDSDIVTQISDTGKAPSETDVSEPETSDSDIATEIPDASNDVSEPEISESDIATEIPDAAKAPSTTDVSELEISDSDIATKIPDTAKTASTTKVSEPEIITEPTESSEPSKSDEQTEEIPKTPQIPDAYTTSRIPVEPEDADVTTMLVTLDAEQGKPDEKSSTVSSIEEDEDNTATAKFPEMAEHVTEKSAEDETELPIVVSADDELTKEIPKTDSHKEEIPETDSHKEDTTTSESAEDTEDKLRSSTAHPLFVQHVTDATTAPVIVDSHTDALNVTESDQTTGRTEEEFTSQSISSTPIPSTTSTATMTTTTTTPAPPPPAIITTSAPQFPTQPQPTVYGQQPQYPPQYEDEYTDEDEAEIFGPGTCRYGGKLYVSAQQIPRDDPCDFCFCFRSDIICLQQSCPPPIAGCHEEPISGFCCPRYECPVTMATVLNITTSTTTTSTTLPPHFLHHSYGNSAQRNGCLINGRSYRVGEKIESTSGPCINCTCGGDGKMKCDPQACVPEPTMQQVMAVVASARKR